MPYIYFSNLDLGPEEDLPRDEKIEDGEDKSWGQEALYKLCLMPSKFREYSIYILFIDWGEERPRSTEI